MVDPDLQIRGGPAHPDPDIRGMGAPQHFFLALWASAWSKNKEGGGGGLPGICPWFILVENSLYICSTFLCNATLYCSLKAN